MRSSSPGSAAQAAWVYVLRCGDGTLYTGWSNNLDRRLAHHRAGRASRYTASRLPVELVLALPMADRSAAMREEARIKTLDRAAKLALIARHAGTPEPAAADAGPPVAPAAGAGG